MTSVGDYDLEHQIGAGASGTVWKAHRRGPVTRVVALKRLRSGGSAADLARIRREATVLTELDHPHVVRVLEVVHDGDGVALAMQFAPGGSLDDLLAERGRLSPGQVVAVAAPIADALASAHRRGILHGDVKPANVLFTSDGEPLLPDSEWPARWGHDQRPDLRHRSYLAPELLDGAPPDPRADIYSLGSSATRCPVSCPTRGRCPSRWPGRRTPGCTGPSARWRTCRDAGTVVAQGWPATPSSASRRPTSWRVRCGQRARRRGAVPGPPWPRAARRHPRRRCHSTLVPARPGRTRRAATTAPPAARGAVGCWPPGRSTWCGAAGRRRRPERDCPTVEAPGRRVAASGTASLDSRWSRAT